LQKWDDDKQNYDRLGLKADKRKIFDTYVSYAALPITEARNAATLVEAAAFDFKSKNLGYNSAEEFNVQLNEHIKKNKEIHDEED
jgi:HPr kinase/phosphorylase